MTTDRNQLKVTYKNLYHEVQRVLFVHDLMGINFETNTDEYDPEVDTILPRLRTTKSPEDVTKIIIEEFEEWFGKEETREISKEKFNGLANDIWAIWSKFNSNET